MSQLSHLTAFPKLAVAMLSVIITLTGCRDESLLLELPDPPTQRASAKTVSYLGDLTGDVIRTSTFGMAGTSYAVHAIDSTHFGYDPQQRLIQYRLTQISQTFGKKSSSTYNLEYEYGTDKLAERDGFYTRRYPLDGTQRRIVSRNRTGYASVTIDTLRQYAAEGILISAFQVSLNSGNAELKRWTPNVKTTVESGDAVRLEEYNPWSGNLEKVTRCYYDRQHYGPLATITFLGEASRHALVKKIVTRYKADGSTVDFEFTYTYSNEYNRQGQMSRQLEFVEGLSYKQKTASTLTQYDY